MPSPVVKSYSAQGGARFLLFGFAGVILIGAVLLHLPQAVSGPQLSWLEAVFTATSATTVTGLVLFNTEATFSVFGEVVILALIQIGGIGFITLSVFLLRLIGRSISLGERRLVRSVLGALGIRGSVMQLAVAVLGVVFAIQLLGAIPLFVIWRDMLGGAEAAYYAVFHSVSAFANAGFDLFSGTADPLVQLTRGSFTGVMTLALLITIGTMGIAAIFDLINYPRRKRISLHTKLIVPLMLVLTLVGTGIFFAEHMTRGEALDGTRALSSFFSVVSSRTAGITLTDMAAYGPASRLAVLVMMFIGGAPASMGGGIGLTTVAVMLLAFGNTAKGNSDVRAFGRTIPTETVYKAMAILGVSTTLVFLAAIGVVMSEEAPVFPLLFEVVSAFSNTGYSLGVTASLQPVSQVLLIWVMFLGRLGPLTLVVLLAERARRTQVAYPEERIIIG